MELSNEPLQTREERKEVDRHELHLAKMDDVEVISDSSAVAFMERTWDKSK